MSQATVDSPEAKIAAHRDDLRDLGESDLPCSEIAETLLEIADEEI